MGCEKDRYYDDGLLNPTTTPPKLSLFSLPKNKPYNELKPGLATPPIHTLASVPFKWEEEPGKPRLNHHHHLLLHQPKSKTTARCLNLPPRLLYEANTNNNKVNNIPSPTTVLDGSHCLGAGGDHCNHHQSLSRSRSLSFEHGRSFSRSSRWGSFRRNNYDKKRRMKKGGDGGGAELPSAGFDDVGEVHSKVKITRIKRQSSFLSFSSSSTSILLTNIYEGFKQVIPWRRKERN